MDESRKRKLNGSTNCDDDDRVLTKKPTYANGASGKQRIIGPAHPSSVTYKEETSTIDNDDDSDSDDDDDDDIGPTFPPTEFEQPQFDNKANSGSYKTPEMSSNEQQVSMDKNQRDEWMLRPPEGSDWTSRVDPTKLRHRKFQTGKSARTPSVASRMDASWIENPEQKMERIKDEMMGVKNPTDTVHNESPGAETPKITEAVKARIQKYNEVTRKNVTQQSILSSGDNGDDPSTRPFDREKDMATSSNISNSQRREMLGRAADFGSRFTGGRLL